MIDKKAALRDMLNGVKSPHTSQFVKQVKAAETGQPVDNNIGGRPAMQEHFDRPMPGTQGFKDFDSFGSLGSEAGVQTQQPVNFGGYGASGGYPSVPLDAVQQLMTKKSKEQIAAERAPSLQEKINRTPQQVSVFEQHAPSKDEIRLAIKDELEVLLKPELREMVLEIFLDEILTGDRMEKFVMKTVLKVLKGRK
jgi:hypothetical protein